MEQMLEAKSKTPLKDRLAAIKNEGRPDYQEKLGDWLKNPRLSYSSMKHFIVSPWDFIKYRLERQSGEKTSKSHLDKGGVFELMLLQPEIIDDQLIEMPIYKGAGCVAKREEFRKLHPDKVVATGPDIEEAFLMYKNAIHHEDVQMLLEQKAAVQEEVYWKDPSTKLRNLSIIDFRSELGRPGSFICDVKTTRSAERNKFKKDIMNYDYHLQTGAFLKAYQHTKFEFPDYYWLTVENEEPYGVNVFRADNKFVTESKRYYGEALKAFKYCMDNNLWHQSHSFWRFMSPYESVEMPYWYKPKI